MGWEYSIKIGGYTYNHGDIIFVKGQGHVSAYAGSGVGITYGDNYRTRFYGVYSASGSIDYPICVGESPDGTSPTANYFIKADQIVSGGTPDTHTVSFNANGGSGAPSSQTKVYGTILTLSSTRPTRPGYTFQGWGTSAADTTVDYAPGAQYGLDQDITLYAIWKANEYTITYKANGGSGSDQTQTATYGKSWTSKGAIFSKPGYTQTSWNTKDDGTGVTYSLSTAQTNTQLSNLTLYAIYTANTYYVKYNANGGSGSMSNSTHKYGTASNLTANAYSRTGHSFKNWNTKADGSGVSYANKASVSTLTSTNGATVNLYAIWSANSYSLTVNPNGGTWNGSTSNQTFTQKYGTTKAISNPTRVGYDFSGWKLNGYGSFSNQTYTYGAGNGELVARWTRIVLKVTFDASTNGGSPNSKKNVNYGDTVGTLPTPTKPFYKFIGWFTKAVGGTQISANNVITSNVTFYAQYKIDASVKVKYNGNNLPAIVWIKVNGVWKKCITWIKDNGKWNKSTGAD